MPPLKLAIVGGGPSAFYVATRILSLLPLTNENASSLRIHMFDRLWAPHGLVRYGVAPDHPEVKNCTHKFDTAAEDPRFRFFGNVNVGAQSPVQHALQIPLSSVLANYSHLLFATGCTLPTLHPSIPPSSRCIPALSLVHWYTQHPSRAHEPPPAPLDRVTHVSLVGVGNVSLDVARMLLTPVSSLAKHDVPAPVLDVLARSRVRHVSIIGRRGPLEAAFTTKELREMMALPDAAMVPLPRGLLDPARAGSISRQQSRLLQLLQKGSNNAYGTTRKTWSLEFHRSPTALALPSSPSEQARLTLAHTTLDETHARAIPTGETSVLPTDLVVTSLGFHGEPSAPFYDPALGHLRTTAAGHVLSSAPPFVSTSPSSSTTTSTTPDPSAHHDTVLHNVYASGWAATGAKGVLAATMLNAYAVADTILSDWLAPTQHTPVHTTPTSPEDTAPENERAQLILNPDPDLDALPPEVERGVREGVVTQYADWKAVDREEVRRGERVGKERERMGWQDARDFLAGSGEHS